MRLVMPPILMLTCAAIASSVTITPVFTPGEGGYASFRIPGVVQAGDAHLAFAEGRKYACTDFGGQHDIVSKRSEDGGISWGPLQVIADPEKLFGCQNGSNPKSGFCEFWDPTAVYDSVTDRLILLAAYASSADTSARLEGRQDLFSWVSGDRGATWGQPKNLTSSISGYSVPRATPANGHGVQMSAGTPFAGRLVVPAYGRLAYGSATFFSDDHGQSWRLGKNFGEYTSEGDIAEVPGGNGTLLYNLRFDNGSMQCGKYKHCRVSSVSHDGGETWSDIRTESGLPDPGCKGGIAEVMKTEGAGPGSVLVFANDKSDSGRFNVTVRVSHDGGVTWPAELSQLIWPQAAGYVDVFQGKRAGEALVVFENATCSIVSAILKIKT